MELSEELPDMTAESAAMPPVSIIVPAEEGTVLQAFGDTVQIKLSGEQTKGSLVVALGTTPPGAGPPPHIHHAEDELFLVLEGQIRFFANGRWTEAVGTGTVVYTQRGAVHTFQNVGDTPSRHWIIATPSGFEQFFARCSAVFAEATAGPPDMRRILAISETHGIEYVPPLADPSMETALPGI